MEYLGGFLLVVICVFAIMLLRSITTVFHELGHAIPALIFTRQPVNIYIGSYGEKNKTKSFSIGPLTMYFKFKLLDWNKGLCQHSGNTSPWQNILIILGGPLASVLISAGLAILLINQNLPSWLYYLFICFIFGAVLDFFANVLPSQTIHGRDMKNDGAQLMAQITLLASSTEFRNVLALIQNKAFDEAITVCEDLRQMGELEEGLYDLYIHALLEKDKADHALKLYHEKKQLYPLKDDDYFLIGTIYLIQKNYKEAIKYFEHCYVKDGMNGTLLSNMARCHIELGEYQKAFRDATSAIHYDPALLEPYINHGIALMRLKRYPEAFKSLNFALANDETDPRTHFYLAMLYDENVKYQEAYIHYQKAEQFHCEEHGLAYRMEIVRMKLEVEDK